LLGLVLACALSGGLQAGEEGDPARLTFGTKGEWLEVRDGIRAAALPVRVSGIHRATLAKDGRSITVEYAWQGGCVEEANAKVMLAVDELWATLANAEALRRHAKGAFAEAEAGFARAVALQPTFKKAVFNLACAQSRQHKTDAALTGPVLGGRRPSTVVPSSRSSSSLQPPHMPKRNAAACVKMQNLPACGCACPRRTMPARPVCQNWPKNFQTSAGPQLLPALPLSGNGVWSPLNEQNSTG
jgi:hypothetical protein